MKSFAVFAVVLTLCFFPALITAQESAPSNAPALNDRESAPSSASAQAADGQSPDDQAAQPAAPSGKFRAYSLGMDLDELKEELVKDPFFEFRGDRDVSFLPLTEQRLVESEGLSFIKRGFFQLKDGKVFVMAFSFNTDLIDHYSVYTALVEKYGEPGFLNPQEAVWESEGVRLSIERPLTVKYIDKPVFDGIVRSSTMEKSAQRELREEFLGQF